MSFRPSITQFTLEDGDKQKTEWQVGNYVAFGWRGNLPHCEFLMH
jgi:hypothetical protein